MESLKPILLVEDNPLDVELALEAFKAHGLDQAVFAAGNGEEALDYLLRRGRFAKRPPGNPILALLDLKMPKVTGLEVLRRIKSDPGLKRIPVVLITTSKEERDLAEGYDLGANAFVIKPIAFPEFVAAIGTLARFWAGLNQPPPGSVPPDPLPPS